MAFTGLFFREKVTWVTIFSIVLALSGIGLLYQGDGETLSVTGVLHEAARRDSPSISTTTCLASLAAEPALPSSLLVTSPEQPVSSEDAVHAASPDPNARSAARRETPSPASNDMHPPSAPRSIRPA